MRVDPLADVVIIRRLPPEAVSDGGIHLVYDPDYKEDVGIVAFVGPGKTFGCKHCKNDHVKSVAVKPGDKVLFSTNGHQVTTINGEQFIVLREPSIIGVIQ